jgi:hypothetical protein
MSAPIWTPEMMKTFAAMYGLTALEGPQLERMTELANRVVGVANAIPRMPSKSDEPASIFRVPLR